MKPPKPPQIDAEYVTAEEASRLRRRYVWELQQFARDTKRRLLEALPDLTAGARELIEQQVERAIQELAVSKASWEKKDGSA